MFYKSRRSKKNGALRTSRCNVQRLLLLCETLEKRQLLAADLSLELWSDAPPDKPEGGFVSLLNAPSARTMRLDEAKIAELLGIGTKAETVQPEVAESQRAWTITLPNPEGGVSNFRYESSSVMAPELAEQFPEIKTFRGQGIDDPAATIQFDVTPSGLHAQVLSPNGAWYIDPYYHNAGDKYAIYFKRDALPVAGNERFEVELPEANTERAESKAPFDTLYEEPNKASGSGSPVLNRSGAQLRTYRLAVSATGEYTQFHGGTVAGGLSAIVTAVTRVNGIYEQELAVTMQLVANNNLLVFTNAASDPFTNNDGFAMLSQNQTAIDSRIGNSNYDIGHVFSTGGGGVAFLRSVGSSTSKAGGVTGLPQPIGDPFYVDFVAHEIGHQFGGNHTFNGDSGNCSGGNRNGSTAFEPGSGTTIQAYAGICGNDNLQTFSDPQFHSISFDEIIAFVDNQIPGVGTRSNTGNTVPVVDAGSNFTIPTGTPFVLTATGSDANSGDVLTYSWEQRDLGPQSDINAPDNGSIPLFRVFPPTTSPSRTFPRLSDLVNNTTTIGERLPTVARPSMDFRVTVRDNRVGGGGVNTDDMFVNVVNTGAAFQVTQPNLASVDWPASSTQTVLWNVAGTTGNGINTANVDIDLSLDGGLTYPISLIAATPNDGEASIVVPNFQTTTARVRVKGTGNIFFDISNANFRISAPQSTLDFGDAPTVPYGTLLADNGPRHTVGALFLGATVDTEVDGQPGVAAIGDGADEDGVRVLDPIVAGTNVRFEVTASQAGVLNYFIDFDRQGGFANVPGEAFTTNVVAGPQVLAVPIPANVSGESYMRFRLSQGGGLSPQGPAATGEVEDYRIEFLTEPPGFDMGDAPFQSSLAGNGARHLSVGPILGLQRTDDTDALSNATATGDIDDGVSFGELLLPGTTSSALVTSTGGILNYFVDFDRNGVFGNVANEIFSMTVTPGTVAVPINVPAGTTPGPTFARFRLSTAGGLTATGLSQDGEVEDYQVMVSGLATSLVDFQNFDASSAIPAGWTVLPTTGTTWSVATTGALSQPNAMSASGVAVVSDQRLTSPPIAVSADNRTFEFANNFITEASFDGAVLEVAINGGAFQDIVVAGGTFQSNGYTGTIDTRYGSAIGGRSAWTGNSNGWVTTRFTLPESMIGTSIQLRWRFATDDSVAIGRWLVDSVRVVGGIEPQRDYGDAPVSFPTLVSNNGASHVVSSQVRLGATVDTDPNGQPSASATGDVDDGVILPTSGAAVGTTIDVLVNSSDSRGILSAWFDFNNDGDWNDPGEQAIRDLAIAAGNQVVPVAIPSDAQVSSGIATRFRFSRQAGLLAVGAAGDGEVEDYLLPIVSSPATVSHVYVSSSEWPAAFVDSIDGGGAGSGNGIGLELLSGSATLPWNDVNRLHVQFSRAVLGVSSSTIELRDSNGPLPISVVYNPTTFTAIVSIGTSLNFNKLRLGVSDLITDVQGNSLDGDGSGSAGGILDRRFDIVAADTNNDGRVTTADLVGFANSFNAQAGQPTFLPRANWNGDDRVSTADLGVFSVNFGKNITSLSDPSVPFSGGGSGGSGTIYGVNFNDLFFAGFGKDDDEEEDEHQDEKC